MKKLTLAFALALLSCCSCVFNKAPEATNNRAETQRNQGELPIDLQSFVDKASIQKEWQKRFVTLFAQGSWKKGWMLFSYAGYSNRGQTAVFSKDDQLDYYFAAPNEKANYERLDLTDKQKKTFLKEITKYEGMEDYRRTSFDGVSYEFVVIEATDSGFDTRRFYMNSLGLHKDDEEYRKLVDLMLKVRQ